MKRGFTYFIAAFLFFMHCSEAFSQVQVRASVDKSRILIGEQIKLTLEAYVPLATPVTGFNPDTIPHFEYINVSAIDTTESIEGKKFSQVLTITSFDSGRWEIPQLEFIMAGQAYYTDTLGIDIAYISFDPSADYHDIKEIEEIINPYSRYIPWLIALLTVISIALVAYFLRARKKLAPVKIAQPIQKLSAYDEAMQSLAALQKKHLSENGYVKEYYTDLNNILRLFVFNKLDISTLQKTNDELIIQLKDIQLPKETFTQLAQSLRMSDFVKFAKFHPDANDNTQNFMIIQTAIQSLNKITSP